MMNHGQDDFKEDSRDRTSQRSVPFCIRNR